MTPLQYIRAKGFKVEVKDWKWIRLQPRDKVPEELFQYAVAHKAEILAELRAEILAMTLDDFSEAGLAVRVYSRVLDQHIWLCSDAEMARIVEKEGEAAYLPSELEAIHREKLPSKDLKAVHEVKKAFNGTVRPGQNQNEEEP